MNQNNVQTKYDSFSDCLVSNFSIVQDGSRETLWFWDFNSNQIHLSNKWKQMTGYGELILKGDIKHILSYVFKEDRKALLTKILQFQEDKSNSFSSSFRIVLKNGSCLWVLCTASAKRKDNHSITIAGGALGDISVYKALEENYKYIENFDPVTGIPKSKYVFDKMLGDSKTAKILTQKGAALFIDLDDYRKVKDTYGIEVGNELLKLLVQKVKTYIRERDAISKIDGDKFFILLVDICGEEAVKTITKRILDIIKQCSYVLGHEIYITASAGIIMNPGIYKDYFELIQMGNSAIYDAKKDGKNQYHFFHELSNQQLIQRYDMENDLRKAIVRNEFFLCYQPVAASKTGSLKCLEALIRWNKPQKGIVSPIEFIPIAEESDLILQIGNWVLETACKQNKQWQDKGYKPVSIAVNVSARQLQHKEFFDTVCRILDDSGLEPKYLELEITESVWMKSMETATQKLIQLREKGVRISLDDFGTHYSSLKYLKYLPIDKIKIDRSFIRDLNKDVRNEAIISAIITLAQKMKIALVAEGVEKKEQLDYLREQGCELIQGYLYSKPLPHDQIESFIKDSEVRIDDDCFNYYQI